MDAPTGIQRLDYHLPSLFIQGHCMRRVLVVGVPACSGVTVRLHEIFIDDSVQAAIQPLRVVRCVGVFEILYHAEILGVVHILIT